MSTKSEADQIKVDAALIHDAVKLKMETLRAERAKRRREAWKKRRAFLWEYLPDIFIVIAITAMFVWYYFL